ncbi:MAG TPA: transporter substrate-binding domain-containing protein [Vicinamibacterales bacterium]|nr:transporter substrate-binding domain-containing protein [Vicinamibacterales bacterium]
MWRLVSTLLAAAALSLSCSSGAATSRLARIRQRGVLVCGIFPGIAGFAEMDLAGHYRGFDVDMCRAVAAATVGSADRIRYERIASLDLFLGSNDIDIVSRRLTWSLRREGMHVLFGPVTFYDGQGFLVARRVEGDDPTALAGIPLCVAEGSEHDVTVTAYFRRHQIALQKVLVADGPAAGRALADGRCQAFSGDVSELASVRSLLATPRDFRILRDRISREPLAQLVRAEDIDLFNVLRWTVFAMIAAEEHGVSSTNVATMAASDDPEIQRLLGGNPGNGQALGLDEAWARNVIAQVGNYGEVFERNLGVSTPLGMERGLNALWTQGGLMFAPPLR